MTPVENLLDRLEKAGSNGSGWKARCPAHEDDHPSLSVSETGDGTVLVKCHAGCEVASIVAAVGLELKDLFPPKSDNGWGPVVATYIYVDEDGTNLFRVHRTAHKKFWQERYDNGAWKRGLGTARRVLYHLDEVAGETDHVWVVEGEKDADRLRSAGLVATTNPMGTGGGWRSEYTDQLTHVAKVTVVADRDDPGLAHARTVAASLQAAGINVDLVQPPDGYKDVSDMAAAGLDRTHLEPLDDETDTPPRPQPISLNDGLKVYRHWLGDEYDTDVATAVLAAAAGEQLGGDPLWLLVVGGPGAAKTETVQSLRGAGAKVVATLSGEAALLSATPAKQRSKNATGGLLREIGDRGLMVIKDVTSILSMNRDTRAQLLAAFREIHDGYWPRRNGTDGGLLSEWRGRLVVVGAVTTAWDQAHAVISTMGDRFVNVRLDSTTSLSRIAAGRKAAGNTNLEEGMRQELADAAAGVLARINTDPPTPTDTEVERLLAAADLVTLARTGVEYDYRGAVIDAHAPEMPTRFLKQLIQLFRGATAIGLDRDDALQLAIRCARDSMPPLRLAIIDDVAAHPRSTAYAIRKRIDRPYTTVDRQCQSLHMLGVLTVNEEETSAGKNRWYYRLAEGIDPSSLNQKLSPDLSPPFHSYTDKREGKVNETLTLSSTTDFSGDSPQACPECGLSDGRHGAVCSHLPDPF